MYLCLPLTSCIFPSNYILDLITSHPSSTACEVHAILLFLHPVWSQPAARTVLFKCKSDPVALLLKALQWICSHLEQKPEARLWSWGLNLLPLLSCPSAPALPPVCRYRPSGNSAEICSAYFRPQTQLGEVKELITNGAAPERACSPALQLILFERGILPSGCLLQIHVFIWSFKS